MGTIDGMLLEIQSFTENANAVKSLILTKLFNDKIIDKEQWAEYEEDWHIIVIKRSWFKKALSNNKDDWSYQFVKMDIDE